ncbi:MAG: phosphoribosylamine--glycine ligase [Candidatus Aminicenantes bacterium]|nr:phosphoribosylamine--glycine ligase [Candidatus Aminicenantes bacterium]
MKILVVGSGGREHALAWKLAQSSKTSGLYVAPGNGGTRLVAENVPIPDHDSAKLADFALQAGIGLTVVGPEVPLSLGLVDEFERKGLRVFGPSRKAAELESSKAFSKRFMERHKIPTGRFKIAETADKARAVLRSGELGWPVVLKADGLAAGKGVIIAKTPEEAEAAVRTVMVERRFGSAGDLLLIEEFLRGRETSFIVISDGTQVLPLVTTMDHKAATDGGQGPNTGGMGTISPSPHLNKALFAEVMSAIVLPTVTRMKEEGRLYKGALYCGLMLTAEGPKVLEYNCRFGDPETQPQMLRLESDLVDILNAAIDGNVLGNEVRWAEKAAGCVIMASGGYPGPYEKGRVITGLEAAAARPGLAIFHAGTHYDNGTYRTSGGRVLGVCASGRTLQGAMDRIYAAAAEIKFEGAHYRRDIGREAEPA